MRFDELHFEELLMQGLEAMNFQETTPVQEHSIPPILEGNDVLAVAQTGTGKTAAYLLPLLNQLSKGEHSPNHINAIIMAPTRELALQIDHQIEAFSYFLPVTSVAVYGGTDGVTWEQQKRGMQMGVDVVVATPGRLLSYLKMDLIDLSQVSYFVLDEADRMLDMGFYDDIMQVYKKLNSSAQIVMFSATMPPKIKELTKAILNNPTEVKIAISRPPESIDQSAFLCYEHQKLALLQRLFRDNPPERVILFSSSKLKCKEVAFQFKRLKFNVAAMHSDLDQNEREVVMRNFKNGKIGMLIATDIVARGIDIDDIALVVNYDIPHDPEDYVHRIGRTARANNDGQAITFVSEYEQWKFHQIEKFLGKEVDKRPMFEELGEAPAYEPSKHRDRRDGGRGGRSGGRGDRNASGRSDRNGRSGGERSGRAGNNRRKKPQDKPTVGVKAAETSVAQTSPESQNPAPSADQPQKSKRRNNHRRNPRPKKQPTEA